MREREVIARLRRFATDPDHYDFSAARCVKDLLVDRINYADDYRSVDVEIAFRFEPQPGPFFVGTITVIARDLTAAWDDSVF